VVFVTLDELAESIRRRWWLVLAASVVAASLGFVAAATAAPTYSASARVLVVLLQVKTPTAETGMRESLAAEEFVRSRIIEYTSFASTEAYLQRVIETHKLPTTRDELEQDLSMSSPKDTAVIAVTMRSSSPVLAADAANAAAEELAQVLSEREALIPFRAVVAERAGVPRIPVSPDLWRTVVHSAVLGFIFGSMVAVRLTLVRDVRQRGSTA
jgi:capsular polysaccharide biosynthesis protein